MQTPFKIVIPARYASTRLPGKPLIDIAGKPMIVHVCERALAAKADAIVVATDDQRIADVVSAIGVQAIMTATEHNSGTERLAQVAQLCGWDDSDIIVNLQGDEPLIPVEYIKDVAQVLAAQQQAGIATLATAIHEPEEIYNSNAVKVVLDKHNYALYFSRAAIPWDREGFQQQAVQINTNMPYLRHIGMYAYRVSFLKRYISWQTSVLEKVESLEQLRILWQGESIIVKTVLKAPEAGVDTKEDLQRVIQRLLELKNNNGNNL